jgi:hypothetical protein
MLTPEQVIARVINLRHEVPVRLQRAADIIAADAVTALRDAGYLLQPGGEIKYGVEHDDGKVQELIGGEPSLRIYHPDRARYRVCSPWLPWVRVTEESNEGDSNG